MRIRTVKPDFWGSGKQLRLSTDAALMIISLWNQADDEGRMVDDPLEIGARCPRFVGKVDQLLNELANPRSAFLHRYMSAHGKRYIQIHDWKDHQVINRPKKSTIPKILPSDVLQRDNGLFTEQSRNNHGVITGEVEVEVEVEGKWKGKESAPSFLDITKLDSTATSPVGAPSDWDEPADFRAFWLIYPRKVSKQAALREWKRIPMTEPLRQQIMAAVKAHCLLPQWRKDGGEFVPHPSTWLHGKKWEDEIKCKPTTEQAAAERAASWSRPLAKSAGKNIKPK